jgi:hypothetical protein
MDSLVYFALGCLVGSFTVIGLLMLLAVRGKRRRSRSSPRRRAASA